MLELLTRQLLISFVISVVICGTLYYLIPMVIIFSTIELIFTKVF
jgi:hypothetical protein